MTTEAVYGAILAGGERNRPEAGELPCWWR
jgi:hypothetical protein